MRGLIFVAAVAAVAAGPAMAVQVFSTGYDMPNGGGQASGGSFNYWDLPYSGSGSTNVDGAPLSGGSGDLTDGVVASDFWYNTENNAGTGPYVGWYTPGRNQANPTVTFNFAGSTAVNAIRVHVDNSYVGGVAQPVSILVDGSAATFTPLTSSSIGWLDLSGFSFTGGSHTLQFFQDPTYQWTFVSEVEFYGNVVPEPATWAMMIGGLGLVGSAVRRRRATVVYS